MSRSTRARSAKSSSNPAPADRSYNSAMPKSPKEMGEAIARNLPAKTGRTFEEWVAIARKQKIAARAPLIAWLKSKHELGTVTASFIAAETLGQSIVAEYSDEGALLDGMYSGEK